ncbi:MAG: hypothetical protein IKJ67_10430 [Bacteroidales bacterium]|nr:hypothetical protein [Bacteroidales bacterium]
MKRIYIVLLVTLLGCTTAKSQQIEGVKPEVLRIADSLTGISMHNTDGWAGIPKEWTLQEKLKQIATNDELVALENYHHNAAVRAFAFKVLVDRGDIRFKEILYNSLTDTARFQIRRADILSMESVASHIVDELCNHRIYMSKDDSIYYDTLLRNNPELVEQKSPQYYSFINGKKMNNFRRIFTIQDSLTLDSMLIFTPGTYSIYHKYEILDNLPISEKYYNRLLEMYTKEDNATVLSALCHYRTDEVKEFVIKALSQYPDFFKSDGHLNHDVYPLVLEAIEATAIWPDPNFLPLLFEIQKLSYDDCLINYWIYQRVYTSFINYDNDETYSAIENSLTETVVHERFHSDFFINARKNILKEAFDENPNPRYLPLVEKYCDSKSKE